MPFICVGLPRQRAVRRMVEGASGWGSVTSPLPRAPPRLPSWAPRLLVKGGVSTFLEPFSESTVSLRSSLLGTRTLTERADTEGKGKFCDRPGCQRQMQEESKPECFRHRLGGELHEAEVSERRRPALPNTAHAFFFLCSLRGT